MSKLSDILSFDSKQQSLFLNLEMKLVPILASMENVGIGFVNERCQRDRDQVIAKLEHLEKEAYTIVGKSFSFTSTNEIADILYDQLKLPYPTENSNNNNSNS